MALPLEELNVDGDVEGEEMERERAPPRESRLYSLRIWAFSLVMVLN